MRTGCGALAFRPPHKEKSRIRPRGDGNPRNQEEREAKEGIKLLFKFSKFFWFSLLTNLKSGGTL